MAEPRVGETPGKLVAKVLYGAWRQTPPELESSAEDLDAVAPQLLGSGAAALGWRRVSRTPVRACPAAVRLQQAYRLQTLYAGLHEIEIEQVIKLLRAAGVEPLLVKGLAAAQLYPERGLRPYGDIDLCFETEQYATALAVLDSPEGRAFNVDPHDGLDRFYGLSLNGLLASSQMMKVGKIEVRVPCLEDHLRILCIHFLKHGAWRPLNLCDVAAALESRPGSIDWDRCLGRDKRRADWVACTIGLAHQLLGAEVEDTPVADRGRHLPGWLVPAVLKQWEKPCTTDHHPPELMLTTLRNRTGLLQALRNRWPDPIEATIWMGGSFNELPRLPFQLRYYQARATKFLARLPSALRRQK